MELVDGLMQHLLDYKKI